MVSSSELEQPSSFPCSWRCSSKNHKYSSTRLCTAIWSSSHTMATAKHPSQGQMGLGRHQHTGRASNLKQMAAVSPGEEQQVDASQRQTQVVGYRLGSYSSKKGHLEKQQGPSILAIWVGNSTNCLKLFCDRQQPHPAVIPQLFPL